MSNKVSIVTTAYNAQRFIDQSLRSVDATTEHIVFDDGSNDKTSKIIAEYATTHANAVAVSSPHVGRIAALRAACELATGDYIGVVDADDVLGKDAIRSCAEYLDAHPDCPMVYTNYEEIDAGGKTIGPGRLCQTPWSREIELEKFVTHHFRLIRKSAFDAVGGFDKMFVFAMDYDLCLRLSEMGDIGHIAESHYQYRLHFDRISVRFNALQGQFVRRAQEAAIARRRNG